MAINHYVLKGTLGYTMDVHAEDLDHMRKKMAKEAGFDGYRFDAYIVTTKTISTKIGRMKFPHERHLGTLDYGYSTQSNGYKPSIHWTPVGGRKKEVDPKTGKLRK